MGGSLQISPNQSLAASASINGIASFTVTAIHGIEICNSQGRGTPAVALGYPSCTRHFMHPSSDPFPADARSAYPLFYRSYSRRLDDGSRESWEQVVERNLSALAELGRLNPEQEALLRRHQLDLTSLPSGRWLWVGGTPWATDQRNFYGAYNCSSVHVDQLSAFGLLMDLAMQGTGTGAVLTRANVGRLPKVVNRLEIDYRGSLGSAAPDERSPRTAARLVDCEHLLIKVGDSRDGWVTSYQKLIQLACGVGFFSTSGAIKITIDLSWVRPPGERLKGFGGVANPSALPEMYARAAGILNRAIGRQLTPLECCLIIDEAARCVVAGNIRRSAGMRQFDEDDLEAAGAKRDLWGQDEQGHWAIDPERDALRMANHTRLFHRKPTHGEVLEAVRSQHACGEGAIQFAPEALARANADILGPQWLKESFLAVIEEGGLEDGAKGLAIILFGTADLDGLDPEQRRELSHRMSRFGLNPCGEILGSDFLCNLAEVHLNRLDPNDSGAVEEAFRAAALTVSVLLHHRFRDERIQEARLRDPIVGVSFTGLFDDFARALGVDWLRWWAEGRPPHAQGAAFSAYEVKTLRRFRAVVEEEVATYCEAHGLKVPNRCTTVQPAGCLGLDAVRVTSRGLLLFDEAKLLSAWHQDDPLLIRGTLPVVDTVRNEPRPALRLTLVSGRQIACTPDHRFWVKSMGWVQAQALRIGHELQASPGEHSGRPVATQRLEEPEMTPAKAPSSLTPGLAYVAGVSLIKNPARVTWPTLRNMAPDCLHFSFPLTEGAAADRLNEWFEGLFETPLKRRLSGHTIHLFSREAPLRRWLETNGLLIADAPETHRLPLSLRQSTASAIRSFFAGLIDATASKIRDQPPVIKIQSEPLARHLQQVGEAVGLVFRLQRHQNGKKPYWKLTLSRFWSTAPALDYLATYSLHCQGRDMRKTHNCFGHHYWQVAAIEQIENTATADICLDADDDDAWYWAGAIKSHNSKSLLTNASPGWHPPKAPYYIRRITFAKDDPIALACLAYGYPVVPSQSDKDESGRLLSDPHDPRCTEWLVEIPTATPWAELEGAAEIDTGKFPALAQFDFYMSVQKHYSGHNTSATLELTEAEIEPLATAIHTAIDTDQGYISAALLARFEDKETFPRMPFEPISKERYEVLCAEVERRRANDCFFEALAHFDSKAVGGAPQVEGPTGCDSDRCLMPEAGPGA